MKILVVEDDAEIADFIVEGLRQLAHTVTRAATGKDGMFHAISEDYDALVVDLMLPDVSGLSIVKAMRAAGKMAPVIILSARANAEEKIHALDAGCDDYLAKPFVFGELVSRLNAIVRRTAPGAVEPSIKIGDLVLDRLSRTVTRAGRRIDLQPQEYLLLEYLARHRGQVVTRTMLLEDVWGYHFDPKTSVIDVHISKLRQKIDKDFRVKLIRTVRGAGYMMCAAESAG